LAALAATTATAAAAGYLGPASVLASKDGKSLYVAELDAKQIAVVDIAAGKVARTIAVPGEPSGMVASPDGSRLYVTCAAAKSVVCELDPAAGRVLGTIPAGHTATGAAIAPDGTRLYVCNRFSHHVAVIDLQARREIARVPVSREPCAAAATPDGKSVFVLGLLPLGCSDSYDLAAEVTVIDTASQHTAVIRLPNGSTSLRGLCVSPDGKFVYAVHVLSRYALPTTQLERGWMNTNAMSIIDAVERKLINTVLLDDVDLGAANPWGVAATADGKTICVSHAGSHELSLIDAEGLLDKLRRLPPAPDAAGGPAPGPLPARTNQGYGHPAPPSAADVPNDLAFLVGLRRRIKLDGLGPRGVAVVGSTVYVAEYFSDALAAVDLGTQKADSAHLPERPGGGYPLGVAQMGTFPSLPRRIALGPEPQLSTERRGELLFHDARMCFQQWQSCATCHPDARVDGLNWDLLNDGLGNPKNTRTMLGVHEQGGPAMSLGVRESAEAAVRAGITHILFAVRPEEDAQAIDAYLRALRPVPSPYLVDGRLSPAAEHGKKLFFDKKVGCASCHPEPLYTDKKAHDVGSTGKYDKPQDHFNTPRLIEVWRTAPYMHDGHWLTIDELLSQGKHGTKGGDLSGLSAQDLHDLAEFVLSL
jgi:YVTN family beta-propeller protein